MKKIDALQFVRRLKDGAQKPGSRFAFFLGAGCSVTSGIPTASGLVQQWLPRLKTYETGDASEVEDWAKKRFKGFVAAKASLFYGQVIESLFLTHQDRQHEIERLIGGIDPGFGYAVLAQLVSCEAYGEHCNVVLTTNFDDLVADAMYLYANRKPLAIVHESLAGFVMVSRTSPVVIKLHGDARLAPRNTLAETQALDAQIQASVISILQETGLIFTGYGGNDNSILKMLRQLPVGKPPGGVYWINDAVPDGDFKKWLEEKNALWVTHRDFDELMLLILSECGLEHPQEDRFSKLIQAYRDRFKGLQDKVFSRPESRTQKFLKEAAQAAASRFKDWWSVHLEAERLAKTSPEAAERVYEDGANQFPNDTGLLGNFANFLNIVRKNYDKAEAFYKRAIESDPKHANNLGNYAIFLNDVRKDYDKAEAFYKRAIESDPKHANNLGSYANFLKDVRKDYNQAEAFYKRAIESDPKHASHLGNYANFLKDVRKDYNQAEAFYKRAIESDPKNADNLGNYSGFLLSRGRAEEAWPLLERVYSLLPSEALRLECAFYEYAHSPDPNRRHQALRRAKELLIKGVRSPGWNLADNAVRAEADGHPNVPLLRNLAEVITKDAPLSDLEPFKEWTDIGG